MQNRLTHGFLRVTSCRWWLNWVEDRSVFLSVPLWLDLLSPEVKIVYDHPPSVGKPLLIQSVKSVVPVTGDGLPHLAIDTEHRQMSCEDDHIANPALRLQYPIHIVDKGHHPPRAERIERQVRPLFASRSLDANSRV